MRIAVVEPEGRGGMAQVAFQLCRALAEEGAEVTLVTDRHYELAHLTHPFALDQPFDLWDPKPVAQGGSTEPSSISRRLRRLGRGARYLAQWHRLAGWLDRRRFDVVQLGDVRFPVLWPLVARLARVTARRGALLADVCHNVHPFAGSGSAAGTFRRGALTRFAYGRIYRLFDRVFVFYEVNRHAFLDSYRVAAERVVSLPLGNQELLAELADPVATAADLRRRLELPGEVQVVLLFGTLSPYKGVDLLIDAFARLAARRPRARLVVAGFPLAGFDLGRERRRAAELGVAERVTFVPEYLPSSEVAAWMELATVAAFPYRSGSQSAAVQTALTFGVPVVAAAVGAMPELLAGVGDAGRARRVPPEDPAALAAALEELLAGPAGRETLEERRQRAAEIRRRTSWRHAASILLETYAKALGREAAP